MLQVLLNTVTVTNTTHHTKSNFVKLKRGSRDSISNDNKIRGSILRDFVLVQYLYRLIQSGGYEAKGNTIYYIYCNIWLPVAIHSWAQDPWHFCSAQPSKYRSRNYQSPKMMYILVQARENGPAATLIRQYKHTKRWYEKTCRMSSTLESKSVLGVERFARTRFKLLGRMTNK